MLPRSFVNLARIAVLAVLVFGATWGGSNVVSVLNEPAPTATVPVDALPAEVAEIDPTSRFTFAPTPTPFVAGNDSVQTPIPTAEPTPAPTPPPTGRGSFPVPENTSGASLIIERGPADQRTVALTFDAGEGPGYTAQILDLLKAEGIHASFGTTGEWARANPDLILRIVEEGHLLFNHSESHRSWDGRSPGTEPLTDAERTAQVMDAHNAVVEIAEYEMSPFWRPPYGDYDAEGQVLLASLGYDYTLWWTCDSLGWSGSSAQEIAEWCGPTTDNGGPGAIILYHVSQEQDYLSLEQVIGEYRNEGYQFVTVDKMIGN